MGEIVYYIPSHSFLIREQEFEKMPFTWKNPQNINIAFNSVRCYKQPFYLRTLKGDTKESLVNFGFHLLLDFLLVCREILIFCTNKLSSNIHFLHLNNIPMQYNIYLPK